MNEFHDTWREFRDLKESSLSRLHQHTQEHDTAILTAHRAVPDDSEGCITDIPAAGQEMDSSRDTNKERNRGLKAILLRKGYGVTRVDGSYVENFEDPDPLRRVEVSESSFFVVNLQDNPDFAADIKDLGELFCQDSVLIIPQGGDGSYLLGTNDTSFPGLGNTEDVGGFSPGREAEFMSRLRGRPFTFKEVKSMETFKDLSTNAKWVVAKITERLSKRTLKEQQLSDYESQYEPGKIRLFHFTRSPMAKGQNRFVVDPALFVTSRGSYSRNEWKRSRYPRSFYYTDPARKEHIVTGDLFSVDVPAERIYNLRQDPDGYLAKHRHPTYGLRDDREWTEMFEDIADSYGGVYYTLGEGGAPVVAYFDPLETKKVEEID
jgi:hypothetical protein